ncbi:MAG: hypothetical protein C0467_13750 [Planctomycetaceae bacterium]|nr:hypothetical protein [Planctomycetaceae bacterium]
MVYSESDLPPLLVDLIRSAQGATRSEAVASQADLCTGEVAVDAPPFFDAISLSEAIEIYTAVRFIKPTDSAEIGFCCGGSGMAILKALADNDRGTHHVCDPYQTSYANGTGRGNVETAALADRLKFHEAFPEQVVPIFPRLQFAFVDASHLFDLSVLDFVLIDKKLDVGGVIAFHDLWMGSLQKLTRYILRNRGYRLFAPPGAPLRPRTTWSRRVIGAILRRFPGADKVFTQELLHPWTTFGIGNLLMLQKIHDDDRDWRHFVRF